MCGNRVRGCPRRVLSPVRGGIAEAGVSTPVRPDAPPLPPRSEPRGGDTAPAAAVSPPRGSTPWKRTDPEARLSTRGWRPELYDFAPSGLTDEGCEALRSGRAPSLMIS